MSNTYTPNTAPPGSHDEEASSAGSAREQAARVTGEAAAAGAHVADVSKDQAHRVASEAKKQAADVLAETRTQLTGQAAEQQARVASGLRSISDELTEMARSTAESSEGGVASDLVQQAAQRAGTAATWLDARDPGSLLREVRDFARRKPGTFIALAATVGVLAGRLTRSVVSNEQAAHADGAQSAPEGTPGTTTPGTTNVGTATLGAGTGDRGIDGLGGAR